jgi:Mlc titration factor MtfA (ptsG expression regulator)
MAAIGLSQRALRGCHSKAGVPDLPGGTVGPCTAMAGRRRDARLMSPAVGSAASRKTPERRGRLGSVWEKRVARSAWMLAIVSFFPFALIAVALGPQHLSPWVMVPLAAAGSVGVYTVRTRKLRRRKAILDQAFPPAWEEVLQREVLFFRTLEPAEQVRFRRELQVFLGETRVTGIGTDLDETTKVLAGASAIIPIFGFPEWEWDQISEVLIYPSRFDRDFSFGDGKAKRTLGMVGTGAMNRIMILSRPDLLGGFRNAGDKRNVGLHEFAHLVDKSDGSIDGIPAVGLERQAIGPWIDLVRRKMAEIERGESDLDPYALTNEAEFFAVASEYFFERPGVMERKHPELYEKLARVFRQNLTDRVAAFTAERVRPRPRFGRNSPCPCGSGKKYKRCCRRRRESTSR